MILGRSPSVVLRVLRRRGMRQGGRIPRISRASSQTANLSKVLNVTERA